MSKEYLPDIIKLCESRDPEFRQKAVATLQQLTKHGKFLQKEDNRSVLVKLGVLKILTRVLSTDSPEATHRYAVVALFRLVSNNDRRKVKIVKYGALDPLINFLLVSPTHSSDLKYWSLLLVHQLSLTDDMELVSWAVFLMHEFVIKDIARQAFCNVKGILKILSSLLGTEETCIPRIILRTLKCLGIRNEAFQLEMVRSGLVKKTIPCLKSSDEESQYWALALLHDLVGNAEAHEEFIECKGLDILIDLCGNASVHLSLYIADIFVYLCSSVRNHSAIAASEMLYAVLQFCRSDEVDLQYAGAALLLNLATISNVMVQGIADNGGIELLKHLVLESDRENLQTVSAKTLTTIAGKDPTLKLEILSTTISPLVAKIVMYVSLCLNSLLPEPQRVSVRPKPLSSASSGTSPINIESSDVDTPQTPTHTGSPSLQSPSHEQSKSPVETAITTVKTSLERLEESLHIETLHNTQEICNRLIGYLDSFYIFGQPGVFDSIPIESNADEDEDGVNTPIRTITSMAELMPDQLQLLASCILDVLFLPVFTYAFVMNGGVAGTVENDDETPIHTPSAVVFQEGCDGEEGEVEVRSSMLDTFAGIGGDVRQVVGSLSKTVPAASSATSSAPSDDQMAWNRGFGFKDMDDRFTMLKEVKDALGTHAVSVLAVIFKYDAPRNFLLQEKVLALVVELIREKHEDLTDQALVALSNCVRKVPAKSEILKVPYAFTSVLRHLFLESAQMPRFYGECFLEVLCDYSCHFARDGEGDSDAAESPAYVMLSKRDRTPYILLSPTGWEMRNDSWTFESIRGNIGIRDKGRYAYEVVLHTDGIIQIGWATKECTFDPEAGTGVGDDEFSYAYDGHRRKKWHGYAPKDNAYGEEWFSGDVITALIDLDEGAISYYRNGVDLGVAFESVTTNETWYPAISLASGQGGRVRMGDRLDQLQYLPDGYLPVAHALQHIRNDMFPSPTASLPAAVSPASTKESSSAVDIQDEAPETLESIKVDGTPEVDQLPWGQPGMDIAGTPSPSSVISNGQQEQTDDCSSPIRSLAPQVSVNSSTSNASLIPTQFEFDISFYFEVAVGKRGLKPSQCIQIGIVDRENRVHFLAFHCNRAFFVTANRDPEHEDQEDGNNAPTAFDRALFAELQRHADDDEVGTPDVFSPAVDGFRVDAVLPGIELAEGDVLGVGCSLSDRCVVFTINGTLMGPVVRGIKPRLYVPYLRNMPRFILNFGQTGEFKWGPANESLRNIMNYLQRP
ncbi:hypothetical protein HK102_014157 [Quaeritorhiza haematococci]|nr:hypothetical protein HK102_014157 [Quaeritorhiza haematococci]